MQFFDIAVQPNDGKVLYATGKYIYFLEGSAGGADATIAIQRGGNTVYLKPGQAVRLDGTSEFDTTWLISNHKKQAPILGYVLIADTGEFFDNRISGSVEVIDGGKARTLAGAAFGGIAALSPIAGQYTFAQLWNPAASGKNVVLEGYKVSSDLAGFMVLYASAVALATLVQVGQPKKLGGAASVMECRGQASAIAPVAPFIDEFSLTSNGSQPIKLVEPIVIPPGRGVIITNASVVNVNLAASFEWFEENI